MEIFAKMKGEKRVVPTVITYSALISAVNLYPMSYNLYLYLCLYLCLCADIFITIYYPPFFTDVATVS